MTAIIVFTVACLILGLWIKPRTRVGLVVIAIAAGILVLYFWIRPQQL